MNELDWININELQHKIDVNNNRMSLVLNEFSKLSQEKHELECLYNKVINNKFCNNGQIQALCMDYTYNPLSLQKSGSYEICNGYIEH